MALYRNPRKGTRGGQRRSDPGASPRMRQLIPTILCPNDFAAYPGYRPRGGWGYSRVPLFVVSEEYMLKILSEKDGRMESMHGSLHEMGHFWWMLANSSSSDD